ncbi:hypothetical protein ACHAXS_013761, partial [Conticribra weissflogii]
IGTTETASTTGAVASSLASFLKKTIFSSLYFCSASEAVDDV